MTRAPVRLPPDASPEDDEAGDRADSDDENRREQDRTLKREVRQPHSEDDDGSHRCGRREVARGHRSSVTRGYSRLVTEANYVSGEDYIVEFLG